jgi:hypothetical protein
VEIEELDDHELCGALRELAEIVDRIPPLDRDVWRADMREWAAHGNIPGAPTYSDLARVWLDLAELVWSRPRFAQAADPEPTRRSVEGFLRSIQPGDLAQVLEAVEGWEVTERDCARDLAVLIRRMCEAEIEARQRADEE